VEKDIVTEIEIDAPPSRVWEILTDFEKYASWNPFIKKISGTYQQGMRSMKFTCLTLEVGQ
jgi:uncharacterized protein YndB with AHSA1/START domain